MPYLAARPTSRFRFAIRSSEPTPNSGYFGSFTSVLRTTCIHTAFTPSAASFCRSPSGNEPISGSPSGSP